MTEHWSMYNPELFIKKDDFLSLFTKEFECIITSQKGQKKL